MRTAEEFLKSDILDFPLVAPDNTSRKLDVGALIGKRKNIYFGTGVATPKAISRGLPFDFLGMVLMAEWMRRKTDAPEIIHEISDVHALADPAAPFGPKEIADIAGEQQRQVTQFVLALGIESSYRCVLASEYRQEKALQEIQAEVDRLSPNDLPYIRFQSAGNAYFARHRNVGCKIGWLVDDNEKPHGLDERTFNNAYERLGFEAISFAYTWCGWNFDPKRSRVSPYTFVEGEKRLMLRATDSAVTELADLSAGCGNWKISRAAIFHYARILTAYENLFDGQGASFWTDSARHDSQLIEIPRPQPWTSGKYIDVTALGRRIGEIRELPGRRTIVPNAQSTNSKLTL